MSMHADGALLNAFPGRAADIVVLSPESPNVLEVIDETKIYVLGGIADNQNSLKGATLNRAAALGVSHARLPLREYFEEITTRGTVLNINHCYHIM